MNFNKPVYLDVEHLENMYIAMRNANEKNMAEKFELERKLGIAEARLRKISLNRTDEGSIYTMGCDCHEEARGALKQIEEEK